MKYTKLLRAAEIGSMGVVETTPKNASNEVSEESSVERLIEIMRDIAKNNIAPENVENTILNDDEIAEILSRLMEYQEKYFYSIPLANSLVKQFVWNIPKTVYYAFRDARDYGIDIIDPILLFYVFCTEDPRNAMPVFIDILLRDVLNDRDMEYVAEKAARYQDSEDDED